MKEQSNTEACTGAAEAALVLDLVEDKMHIEAVVAVLAGSLEGQKALAIGLDKSRAVAVMQHVDEKSRYNCIQRIAELESMLLKADTTSVSVVDQQVSCMAGRIAKQNLAVVVDSVD